MSLLVLLPFVVLAVGLVAVALSAGRTADEAEQLRAELLRAGALRPMFAEVADESGRLRAALRRIGR